MKRKLISQLALISAATLPFKVWAADNCVKLGVSIVPGQTQVCGDPQHGGVIVAYLKIFLQFLSSGVGIVIVLMLVIAGIQYITSTGDPALVKAAKQRIINAITALVLFVLSFAILSFIVPGGVFG